MLDNCQYNIFFIYANYVPTMRVIRRFILSRDSPLQSKCDHSKPLSEGKSPSTKNIEPAKDKQNKNMGRNP